MRFPRRELGLALVCGGLLMMEICLTKIFSIVLWYHFGFLAISSALLGFASSGVYLSLRERVEGDAADGPIARSAAMAALVSVLSLWLMTETSFDAYSVVQDRSIGTLVAFILWVTVPFFFLGLVISRTLAAFPERANILYGFDLVGSALGCGAAVVVLNMGHPGQLAMLLAAITIALGGALFAGKRIGTQICCTLPALAAPVLGILLLGNVEEWLPLKSPDSKPYYRIESIDQLNQRRESEGRAPIVRGPATLVDGSTIDIELDKKVTDPTLFTADGRLKVQTDDGEMLLDSNRVAEKEVEFGKQFDPTGDWQIWRQWTSLSRVDLFHWPAAFGGWGFWGLQEDRFFAADSTNRLPRQKGITIDAWAMTSIMRYDGQPLWPPSPETAASRKKVNVVEFLPAGAVHRLFPEGGHDIVCIGAGGGLDLMTAKYFGARKIDGVEINRSVYESVQVAHEFAGNLYNPKHHPDVNVYVSEGRHFLERSEDKYDVVQLSGVDTFSTTEAGAFSLSENYLYTVEAFQTYAARLKPEGAITLTRWFYPDDVKKYEAPKRNAPEVVGELEPRYSLRLLALVREGLESLGNANPGQSIFFLYSENFTVILAKPIGFSESDLETLHGFCKDNNFGVLYSPRGGDEIVTLLEQKFHNPIPKYMATDKESARGYLEDRKYDVVPPTDDRPFFFEISKFEDIVDEKQFVNVLGGFTAHGTLSLVLVEVLLLGLLFVILPLRRLSKQPFPGAKRVRWGILLYFTSLGFGFIVVEIILAQKFVLFLGHPVYSLAVVLFSMLLFSGIGSMLAYKFPLPRFATWLAGGLAVGMVYLFPIVFEHCLSMTINARVAISVAILAPLGLAMGLPFPIGLRVLNECRPQLIPWAWAINGYTSVIGSVLAVVLALELGFTVVLFIAAGIYGVGVIGYSLMATKAARGGGEVADAA